MLKKCACCGIPFDAESNRQKFCKACKEAYREKPPVHMNVKFCPVCNEPFVPVNAKQKYCSVKCKQKEGNRRYAEKQKIVREKKKSEKEKKRRQRGPKIRTEWWKKFEKADNLTKDAMLARRFGYRSYAAFISAVSQGKEDRQMLIIAAMMEEQEIEERSKKDEAI